MAGGYAVGIIAATGKVDTKGYEQEGGGDGERTHTTMQEAIQYGSIFAEYSFGEMYGLTLGASYTPVDSSIGAQTRTDSGQSNLPKASDDGTYQAAAEIPPLR